MSLSDLIGLLGILIGLGVLIWLAFKGWSVLLLAPIAAMIAALFSSEPLLAHWTQTFMRSAAGFLAQFFPLFLLGALFGKLMEDSGSVSSIADYMTKKLGAKRAILAVVLGGAVVTYGGVSLFVAFFVIAPMAQDLFRAARIPRRLMPAAIMLGTSTFTMSAMPGTPSIQNTIPMPFFGTTPFAAPGLGVIATLIMLGFGLWWLAREEAKAHLKGEGFGDGATKSAIDLADDLELRERATAASAFDTAEIAHGKIAASLPNITAAAAPIIVVILVNVILSLIVIPRLDLAFLANPEWGGVPPAAVSGVWSVMTALTCAIVTVLAFNLKRIPDLRATMDAGVNASALPAIGVASLVGFGAVVGHAGLWGRARRRAGDRRRTACFAGGRDQYPRGADRIGLGRPDHRARCARTDLSRARGADRHGPGRPAPRRGDRFGHTRQPAPQRRRRHAAVGLRLIALGKL